MDLTAVDAADIVIPTTTWTESGTVCGANGDGSVWLQGADDVWTKYSGLTTENTFG